MLRATANERWRWAKTQLFSPEILETARFTCWRRSSGTEDGSVVVSESGHIGCTLKRQCESDCWFSLGSFDATAFSSQPTMSNRNALKRNGEIQSVAEEDRAKWSPSGFSAVMNLTSADSFQDTATRSWPVQDNQTKHSAAKWRQLMSEVGVCLVHLQTILGGTLSGPTFIWIIKYADLHKVYNT